MNILLTLKCTCFRLNTSILPCCKNSTDGFACGQIENVLGVCKRSYSLWLGKVKSDQQIFSMKKCHVHCITLRQRQAE